MGQLPSAASAHSQNVKLFGSKIKMKNCYEKKLKDLPGQGFNQVWEVGPLGTQFFYLGKSNANLSPFSLTTYP